MPKGVMARAGALAGAAGIGMAFASSALPAAGGCYTHQCDASTVSLTTGEWETNGDGSHVYETTPLEAPAGGETWIFYPHNVTLDIHFPPKVAKDICTLNLVPSGDFSAWISTSPQPNVDPAGLTPVAGSLVVFTNLTSTGFSVTNLTCASYYARFTVPFLPAPSDASTEGCVGASTDASADR